MGAEWLQCLLLSCCLAWRGGGSAQKPGSGGEYCHGWMDAQGRSYEGFLCPDPAAPGRGGLLTLVPLATGDDLGEPRLQTEPMGDSLQPASKRYLLQKPIYVPFLIVGSIFIAFIFVGSFVAVYCCTCLRPKQTLQQPMRFSLRNYQMETLPMILTSASLRTPSRQSSTATSSSYIAGSIRRFSFARPESSCIVASSPPPYTAGCLQMGHSISISQPSGFLVSAPYFSYPLDSETFQRGKSIPDLSQS
nr:protein shisa-3 homolog [Pogona vitticeps]